MIGGTVGKVLRAVGAVVVVAGIVLGIWLQTSVHYPRGFNSTVRLEFALAALGTIGTGFVLIGIGHALALYEATMATDRQSEAEEPVSL